MGRVLAFLRDTSDMWSGERLTLIFRRENVGMDFAAHNVRTTCDLARRLLGPCASN